MSLPWFPRWLSEHLERHMIADLPAAAMGRRFYDAWEAEFEHHGVSQKAAEIASIRMVGKAPKPSWHFSALLKAARDVEKAWKAKQVAAISPARFDHSTYAEPIPRGRDLEECIRTARGNGPPAAMMRGLFRRLIREGKINPRLIPDDARQEREVVSGLKRVH